MVKAIIRFNVVEQITIEQLLETIETRLTKSYYVKPQLDRIVPYVTNGRIVKKATLTLDFDDIDHDRFRLTSGDLTTSDRKYLYDKVRAVAKNICKGFTIIDIAVGGGLY